MSSNLFFTLFRKLGFSETIATLTSFPNNEVPQSQFFDKLIAKQIYPNTFFRVKRDLLKHKIISYKLNDRQEKVLFLTEKVKEIWEKLQEIEQLLITLNPLINSQYMGLIVKFDVDFLKNINFNLFQCTSR